MALKLYNTLTRSKSDFVPIDPQNVRLYVCGPTVYDFAHIGNARPVIVFDVLYRLLRHVYGEKHVTYVRNITDVDDKINARALRDYPDLPLNEAIARVTSATAAQFHKDVAALGCLPPTIEPRATAHIGEMIDIIQKLIARGHAYQAAGEVLFDVHSMADYGALSGRKLDDQKAGARVAVDEHKKNAADFVLWKLSSPEEPGWDSPWGRGRPGWHIECSAMSSKHLGESFDIHGGGLDLIFPHHENEIAQSRCAFGHNMMANVWMHNGFVQVEGRKMSKSEGNFVTIHDLLEQSIGDVLRLNMLKTHYRQPIDWRTLDVLSSSSELGRWSELISQNLQYRFVAGDPDDLFLNALKDDLNTPAALARLRVLYEHAANDEESASAFMGSLNFLGFKHLDKYAAYNEAFAHLGELPRDLIAQALRYKHLFLNGFDEEADNIKKGNTYNNIDFSVDASGTLVFSGAKINEIDDYIRINISARLAARAAKNWAESDRIRDELAAQGIVLKDNRDGTTSWEVKR